MTASGGGEGEGVKGLSKKGKRTHGHEQLCGDCRGNGGIRGINANGKNTTKIFKEIKEVSGFYYYFMYLGGLRPSS